MNTYWRNCFYLFVSISVFTMSACFEDDNSDDFSSGADGDSDTDADNDVDADTDTNEDSHVSSSKYPGPCTEHSDGVVTYTYDLEGNLIKAEWDKNVDGTYPFSRSPLVQVGIVV